MGPSIHLHSVIRQGLTAGSPPRLYRRRMSHGRRLQRRPDTPGSAPWSERARAGTDECNPRLTRLRPGLLNASQARPFNPNRVGAGCTYESSQPADEREPPQQSVRLMPAACPHPRHLTAAEASGQNHPGIRWEAARSTAVPGRCTHYAPTSGTWPSNVGQVRSLPRQGLRRSPELL